MIPRCASRLSKTSFVSELFPTKRDIKTADDLQQAVRAVTSVKAADAVELRVYNIGSHQTRAVSVQVAK